MSLNDTFLDEEINIDDLLEDHIDKPSSTYTNENEKTKMLNMTKIATTRALTALYPKATIKLPLVVITTPNDINSMRGKFHNVTKPETSFYCVRGTFTGKDEVVEFPEDSTSFTSFASAAEVVRYVGNDLFVIFNETALETLINEPALHDGEKPLPHSSALFLDKLTVGIGEKATFKTVFDMVEEFDLLDLFKKQRFSAKLNITVTLKVFSFIAGAEKYLTDLEGSDAYRKFMFNEDSDDPFSDIFRDEKGKLSRQGSLPANILAFRMLA